LFSGGSQSRKAIFSYSYILTKEGSSQLEDEKFHQQENQKGNLGYLIYRPDNANSEKLLWL